MVALESCLLRAAPALMLLCVAAGCDALGGDREHDLAQTFREPCVYPRDPLAFERVGTPCLIPTEDSAELPCEMRLYVTGGGEDPRQWSLYAYDDLGRVVAEETRPDARRGQSYKYSYENTADGLTVKRAKWTCDREPLADEIATSIARFDAKGALTEVESEDNTIRLRYETTSLGMRTNVTITDGTTMHSFKLNRRGEIVSRNQSGSDDFPTVLDYDKTDGRVSEIVERSRRGALLRRAIFSWEGERLNQVNVTSYGHSNPSLQSTRFRYDCKEAPTCTDDLGAPYAAAPPKPAGRKPAETMPTLAPVAAGTIDGMQRARDVARRVDAVRRVAGKPLLRWDDTLFNVAQREADDRSRGVTAFNPLSLHMLGFRVAVRVERLAPSAGSAPENDVQGFAESDIWEALGKRSVGLGVARVGNGLPDTGKLALVVVSATKER